MTAAPLSPLPPLGAGDLLSAVSPSGPFDRAGLAAGLGWWALRGVSVVDHTAGCETRGYLAASDPSRAERLLAALSSGARWMHCARGGYGATRVLERAGEALSRALRDRPVGVLGFSDVTALHALWSSVGLRSVHGPMLAAVGASIAAGRAPDDAVETAEVLAGALPRPWGCLGVWSWPGSVESVTAPAAGGNLAVLSALCGTAWQPSFAGRVLLLEDIGEAPYRVDRMLTQLRHAGALDGVAAAVLGDFSDCSPRKDGVTVEAVLREGLEGLGCPIVGGAPFGHAGVHRPWVQGARVTVSRDGTMVHVEGVT